MENSIYPCIWFDGNAKEAAEFYCTVFKNAEITADTPLVVTFSIQGQQLMGLNGGPMFHPNPAISLFATFDTEDEVVQAWDALSVAGKVLMPLDTYPWSTKYGWVEDQYGVSWQLSFSDANGEAAQVFPALMFTGEQNGKAEKAINFYTSLFKDSSIEVMARYEPGDGDTVGHVKYAQFSLNGNRLAAMESSMEHQFGFNEGLSLVVSCDTQEEIDFFWNSFTQEGREGNCGWCQDAFGVWWQVVPSILGQLMSDPEKAPKVMDAFMKMKKFDIGTLVSAAA
ncbi:VOC family protein [Pedobacter sp.]|uniref:VOC family protein n=1 Tax=Pedobacter sp. TaxID=1411316 RepID=UPI003D7F51C7